MFNKDLYYLGNLCDKNHNFENTGSNLRPMDHIENIKKG